jgi:hypothetical protein
VRAIVFVAIAAVGALACGGLLGLDEPTSLDGGGDGSETGAEGGGPLGDGANGNGSADGSDGPQGAGDGGAIDAGSDGSMDGTDACGPVPGNLLANNNADFELGCTGWYMSNGGTVSPSAQAHCGSKACQFCPATTYDTVISAVDIPVSQGEQYELRGFVRAVGAPFSVWTIVDLNVGQIDGARTALSGEYTPLSTTIAITTQTSIIYASLGTAYADGGCLLVDDMVLLRVRDAGGD